MKKILFAGLVLFSAIGFVSCKKDYNCVCRVNNAVVWSREYDDISRADAEDRCDGDGQTAGGSIQWDCDVERD